MAFGSGTDERLRELTAENERLRARLAESEFLLNATRDGIVFHQMSLDPAVCRFQHVNRAACELLGYTAEELLRLSPIDIMAPEDQHAVPQEARKMETESRLLFWKTLIRKDGTTFPAEIHSSVIDMDGRRYVTSCIRDISERRQSEEQLRSLGDNLPDSSIYQFTRDADGRPRFLYLSAGVEKLNGVTVQAVLADASVLIRQFAPRDLERLVQAEARSIRELSDLRIDLPMHRPDGQVRWVRLRARPRKLPDGMIVWDGVQTNITAQRAMTAELAESRERLRLAADAAKLFAFEWDVLTDQVRREGDPADALGVPFREESAQSFFARIHPEDQPRFVELVRSMSPQNDRYTTTYRVVRPDGEITVLEESGRAFFDEYGHFVRLIGMTANITERRRADAQLQASEQRLLLAQEAGGVGVYDWDSTTGEVVWTAQLERIYGMPAPAPHERHDAWIANVHPDDRDRLIQQAQEWLASDRAQADWQYRYIRPDGQLRWIEGRSIVFRDSTGRPLRVIGTNIDVTERKRLEQERQVTRQLMETVVNHMPAAVTLIRGSDLRIVLANAAYRAIGPGKEPLGKTLDELWPETGKAFSELCRQVLQAGEPYHVYDDLNRIRRTPEGPIEEAYFTWSLHRVKLPGEEGWGLLNTAWETTASKQAEVTLKHALDAAQQAKAAAESATRAKDQFIAVLSHELRTPLTPAVAAMALLRTDSRLPSDVRDDLDMVSRNLDLEVRLIADLLDVSRIISGKLHLEKRTVDIAETIREAAKIVAGDMDAKGQVLSIELQDAPYRAFGDAARLQQVFWNLLRNSIKFSPPRTEIAIRGRVIPTPAGPAAVVEVTDHGSGIAPEMLPRLFTAFEQEGKARAFGGLGLGLSICRAVVEMHGGSIAAHSEGAGCGATFTIRLPLETSPNDRPPERLDQPNAGRHRPPSGRLSILVVEDNADTAKLLRRLLVADGHEVRTADSVATALAAIAVSTPDLLISDLGLPDGSGIDLMQNLARQGACPPAIALSGYGTPADIARSREAGFAEHLVKPLSSVDTLREVIARLMIWRPARPGS